MVKNLLFGIVFLVSMSAFAQQEKKWSVEANYPISIGNDLGNDNPGIADLGIKYRFLDVNFAMIGVGANVGVFTGRIQSFTFPRNVEFRETNWIFSPKVFSEFKIPGAERLRPSIGLGYSFVTSNFEGQSSGEPFSSSDSDGGFNLNIGLSYDISKRIFVQVQYEYIPLDDGRQNLGFLKLGAGFRF